MNNKMHLAINSLFYIFRGEHKLVDTKKPSKPASVAFLLHIIDNMKNGKVDASLEEYETSNLDSKANESFKNISDCFLSKTHQLCPKGNYARLDNNEEVLHAFMERYRKNPGEIVNIAKETFEKLIGDVKSKSDVYSKIGRIVLELIDQDSSIDDDYELFVCPNVRSITKKELHNRIVNKCNLEFYPLMIGAMYYIFENGGCEQSGFETIEYWRENEGIRENEIYSQVSFEFSIPTDDDISDDELLKKFNGYVRKNRELIENKKMDILGAEQNFMSLYVGNNLSYIDNSTKVIIDAAGSFEKLKLMENNSSFVVITGDSGYGKSLLLRSMLHDASVEYMHALRDDMVSVIVNLNAYDTRKCEFADFIFENIRLLSDEVSYSDMMKLLQSGKMRLFMDALDEVPSYLRKETAQDIAEFVDTYSKCKYIITSRYIKELGCFDEKKIKYTRYIIEPFDEVCANRLIDNWEIKKQAQHEDVEVLKNNFRRSVIRNYAIKDLSSNPLLLSIMLSVYFDNNIKFESKSMLYKSFFNIIYRRRLNKINLNGGFNTSLSKKELKDFFSELSALCWYDEVQVIHLEVLKKYVCQIMLDNGIDEEPEEIIKDFSEELGLLIRDGEYYSFLHSSFRDYFAAEYFCSKKCRSQLDIHYILGCDKESRELARFMYEINEDVCEEIVLKELNEIFEFWNNRSDDYNTFTKYMSKAYSEYIVLSPKRVDYYFKNGWYNEVYDINDYRSALMELVHVMLRDRVEAPEQYEDDIYLSTGYKDGSLCEALGQCIADMENKPSRIAECVEIDSPYATKTEYIEKEIYESEMYGTEYDDEGLPIRYGEKIIIPEEVPDEGYTFTFKTDCMGNLDNGFELEEHIIDVLMNKNISTPFNDFDRLKVLHYDLKQKQEDYCEVIFGLRKR